MSSFIDVYKSDKNVLYTNSILNNIQAVYNYFTPEFLWKNSYTLLFNLFMRYLCFTTGDGVVWSVIIDF